jgi:outer membrane protein assembly factor BamB
LSQTPTLQSQAYLPKVFVMHTRFRRGFRSFVELPSSLLARSVAGRTGIGVIVGATLLFAATATAADWPMWRGNAERSAVTDDRLPTAPQHIWTRDLGAPHVAWSEDPRLQFDANLHPVAADGLVLVASSAYDCVTALDLKTGRERWRVYAGGPIRLAPTIVGKRVYFGADDGRLYCVELTTGNTVWTFNAALDARRVFGNERLISVWPVRGGPVAADGKLFFTAGVWPFEGTLLYEVDLAASTREPVVSSTLLPDLSPQGHLVLNDKRLVIPNGRAAAYCLDIETKRRIALKYNPYRTGETWIASCGDVLMHGGTVVDLGLRTAMKLVANRPVATPDRLYAVTGDQLQTYEVAGRTRRVGADRRGAAELKSIDVAVGWSLPLAKLPGDGLAAAVHLVADDVLVVSRGKTVFALPPAADGTAPTPAWHVEAPEPIEEVIAADSVLIAVGRTGRLYAFADRNGNQPTPPSDNVAEKTSPAPADVSAAEQSRCEKLADLSPDAGGYCVVLGAGETARALATCSSLRLLVIDADPQRVRDLRDWAGNQQIPGVRLAVLHGDDPPSCLPPYGASLVVRDPRTGPAFTQRLVEQLFDKLRPYGGVLAADGQAANVIAAAAKTTAGGSATSKNDFSCLVRAGALPGAADWTHEYGDAANSLVSLDERVKAPFGLLWYGGPAGGGDLFYNRHDWGPGPTVVAGRMLVQGPGRMASIDIYTGRVLWKKEIREGSGPGRRGNFFEKTKPGFHFVAAGSDVYLVYPDVVQRLSAETGEVAAEFKPPQDGDQWGKVRVWQDQLIAAVFRETEEFGRVPKAVIALNRKTGKVTWTEEAAYAATLIAVGNDRVFFVDTVLEGFYDAWKRRGLTPPAKTPKFIKALDVKTGRPLWDAVPDRTITWLGLSEQAKVLVTSSKEGIDALDAETGTSHWSKAAAAPGFGGHPENVWDKVIVTADQVIDQRGPGRAYDIRTGDPIKQTHPATGKEVDWQFTKTGHHCNYAVASPHLLTFRAAEAGFFDRATGGTARLSGFRSGCRNSLIPAGGVLNCPNYANACSCGYQIFTSLALVHQPRTEMWTYNALPSPSGSIRRLGVNFGAPGDRTDARGTLWTEYPRARDPSAAFAIRAEGSAVKPIRRHTLQMEGPAGEPLWVAATAVEGAETISVDLAGSAAPTTATVRLFFAELDPSVQPGDRVFSVTIQGEQRESALDIVATAGEPRKLVVKTFENVKLGPTLTVKMQAKHGTPLINGMEVMID